VSRRRVRPPRPPIIAALLAVLVAPAAPAPGAAPWPLWGDLEPGPHTVGFRTLETYDHSRSFGDKRDLAGALRAGARSRPVQISLWYPASAETGRPLAFGEYLDRVARETDFSAAVEDDGYREAWTARQVAGGAPRAKLEAVLAAPTAARLDAEPAAGRFPLVLMAPGFGASAWLESPLAEHLASRGYVVASSPSMGPAARAMVGGYLGLETQLRDLEFVLGELHDLPQRDPDATAVVGYSFGGAAAVMLAMRSREIDAVVSLDGSDALRNIVELIERWPFYDRGLRQPYMRFGARWATDLDLRLIQSWRYSDRTLVTFPSLTHFDFSVLGVIAELVPGFGGPPLRTTGDGRLGYEWVCRLTADFLDGSLKPKPGPPHHLRPGPNRRLFEMTGLPAAEAPPTPGQMVALIEEKGVGPARTLWQRFRKQDPQLALFREEELIALARRRLRQGPSAPAIEVLRLAAEVFPQSATVHGELGEVYLTTGARALALASFRRALELAPGDPDLRRRAEELELR
jgi:hypothetical protein